MTFGSLFAGIGGIDLGLERAGMECRFQVELDPFCQKILARHWPEIKRYGDIRTVGGDELGRVDLLAGGYPCQPFSQAGKRGGATDPRHLWPEFARLIREMGPRYVLLENVAGHLSLGFGCVLGDLARLGYDAEWTCLRASDFGASHLRKRVFVVAYRAGRGWGERGESSGRYRLTDGSHKDVADAGCSGTIGWAAESASEYREGPPDHNSRASGTLENSARNEQPGREWESGGMRWRGVCAPSEQLADAACSESTRLGEQRQHVSGAPGSFAPGPLPDASGTGLSDTEQARLLRSRRREEGRATPEFCGAFAPGPTDPRWPAILRGRPDLAPALESPIRGVANGHPDWMVEAMSDRTKRLSRLGNSVVPQIAEWIGRRILAAEAVEIPAEE